MEGCQVCDASSSISPYHIALHISIVGAGWLSFIILTFKSAATFGLLCTLAQGADTMMIMMIIMMMIMIMTLIIYIIIIVVIIITTESFVLMKLLFILLLWWW